MRGTLDELLAGASSREPMKNADSKSAARFERVVVDGQALVVKIVDGREDWLAIGSDDRTARAVDLFENGVYDLVADVVDSTVVDAARLGPGDDPWPVALVMRDVTADLVPEDGAVDLDTHRGFLEAMAALSARLADRLPETVYMPYADNFRFLSPAEVHRQEATGTVGGPQPFINPGWESVCAEAPGLHAAVAPLLEDPAPLVAAALGTPTTFQHGDWKMGNLGRARDGSVIVIDWDRPQIAPYTFDLAWYVAVNCDRLPESKEASCERYRKALAAHGVDTESWWDRQLALSLLGAFLMLGWSKAGQREELGWWEPVVARAVSLL